MESLRVARAGYCYRRPFDHFLERYKSLCPETWPNFFGDDVSGVEALAAYLSAPKQDQVSCVKTFKGIPLWRVSVSRISVQCKKHALEYTICPLLQCLAPFSSADWPLRSPLVHVQ